MNKKEIRQKYKDLRKSLSQEEIEVKSLAIANHLLRMDTVPSSKLVWDKLYYHLFLTIEEQNEINTEYILQILTGKDKEIVISKCEFATVGMTHFLLTDNTKIKKNSYNVPAVKTYQFVGDAGFNVFAGVELQLAELALHRDEVARHGDRNAARNGDRIFAYT